MQILSVHRNTQLRIGHSVHRTNCSVSYPLARANAGRRGTYTKLVHVSALEMGAIATSYLTSSAIILVPSNMGPSTLDHALGPVREHCHRREATLNMKDEVTTRRQQLYEIYEQLIVTLRRNRDL